MKKLSVLVSVLLLLCAFLCTACQKDGQGSTEQPPPIEQIPSEENPPAEEFTIPEDCVPFPLSGIKDISTVEKVVYAVQPDFTDSYTIECRKATALALYDADGKKVAAGGDSLTADVREKALYYLEATVPAGKQFSISATART